MGTLNITFHFRPDYWLLDWFTSNKVMFRPFISSVLVWACKLIIINVNPPSEKERSLQPYYIILRMRPLTV